MAAVEKIEDQRKPDDFFGHRNRIAASAAVGGHLIRAMKAERYFYFAG